MTRISIITPAFNAEKTLGDTLRSVAMQCHPRVEHILVDGASTDGSLKLAAQFPHLQQVVSEPDKGIYDAINKGIQLATGEVVGVLNSDDFYPDEGVLEWVAAVFRQSPVQALYGDLRYVQPNPPHQVVRSWRAGPFHTRKFLRGWMPPHPTFFVRRSAYLQYGLYNTSLRISADYELMLRFLYKHRLSVHYLPQVLVHMRTGGLSNASLRNRLLANREDYRAWKINGLQPHPLTRILKPISKIPQYFS